MVGDSRQAKRHCVTGASGQLAPLPAGLFHAPSPAAILGAMSRTAHIAAAAVGGMFVQALLFYFIAGHFYDALPQGMMPGVGAMVMILGGGLLGAFGGAIAAGFRGRASWWIPILLPTALGAFMVMTEIDSVPTPPFVFACVGAACAFAGWLVAILGKRIGRTG